MATPLQDPQFIASLRADRQQTDATDSTVLWGNIVSNRWPYSTSIWIAADGMMTLIYSCEMFGLEDICVWRDKGDPNGFGEIIPIYPGVNENIAVTSKDAILYSLDPNHLDAPFSIRYFIEADIPATA